MKRMIVAFAAVALALPLAGCGSPEPGTKAACGQLLLAENSINNALFDYKGPKGGNKALRDGLAAYTQRITDAVTVAEPAELRLRFLDLQRASEQYDKSNFDPDMFAARSYIASSVAKDCEEAGIDMPLRNSATGAVE